MVTSSRTHFTPYMIPVGGPLRVTATRRVMLAGDAGGFVNGITAEGIYYAMVSGGLAAGAALAGSTSSYERALAPRDWRRAARCGARAAVSADNARTCRWHDRGGAARARSGRHGRAVCDGGDRLLQRTTPSTDAFAAPWRAALHHRTPAASPHRRRVLVDRRRTSTITGWRPVAAAGRAARAPARATRNESRRPARARVVRAVRSAVLPPTLRVRAAARTPARARRTADGAGARALTRTSRL